MARWRVLPAGGLGDAEEDDPLELRQFPRQDAVWGEDHEMVPIGQYMANLRRKCAKNGLGKNGDTSTTRAAQPAATDKDWNCPWPLDSQRHYRILADLVDADGVLPHIAPGVVFDGDDVGRWLQQQKAASPLGAATARAAGTADRAGRTTRPGARSRPAASPEAKAPNKAQQAFQRGLAALTQWVEREGTHRPVPRAHSEEITVEGEAEPVVVKLGVWVSNIKTRRDKLAQEQLDALRSLGVDWA